MALPPPLSDLNNNLSDHKTSADHDSRYYTEAEIDTKIKVVNDKITDIKTRVADNSKALLSYNDLYNNCGVGINFFITTESTPSGALPSPAGDWMYSQGVVFKRNLNCGIIMLFGQFNGKIAIKCIVENQWSDWFIK